MAKISQDRALIQEQLQYVASHRAVRINPWQMAFQLALEGHNPVEPPSGAYARVGMMTKLLEADAQLAQEERLLAHPDPHQQMQIDKAADRERRAAHMNFLDRYYQQVLKQPNPIPQENQILYIETGYGLVSGVERPGGEDEIKAKIAAANAGQEVGPEGVGTLGFKDPMFAAIAAAGAKHGEKVRTDKEKAKEDTFPVLGQFDKPAGLFQAMMQDYRETVKGEPYTVFEPYKAKDPLTGLDVDKQRKVGPDKELQKQARAEVATRWPGYEKYFPNFVEKGFTDAPQVNPAQGDVSVEKKRAELKAQAPAK